MQNRKQVLSQAKYAINNELWEELNNLLDQRKKVLEEITKQTSSCLEERLDMLDAKINASHKKIHEWNLSKSAKRKKRIEWSQNVSKNSVKSSKQKKINWKVAQEVIDTRSTVRKNNNLWLSEGTLVVHKDRRDCPMIVIDTDNRGYTRVLCGGEVQLYRTLSLRPALSE